MRLVFTAVLVALVANTLAQTENFDKTGGGALPDGWKTGVTGQGSAYWAVSPDPKAPSPPSVLTPIGQGTFPWAVREGVTISDGFVEVKCKTISGKEDQAGGVMWRWKDGNNYYVARANALENNVLLYYTANGRRHTIKYVKASVLRARWHALRVECTGDRITDSLDGRIYTQERDNHITGSGAVGLWTKADSITAFDDFIYGSSKAR
jgi:hypothetical protein